MGINEVFELLGGLALFLFGMNVMSHALERFAGNQMKTIFSKLTSNKFKGFLLGLVVTALIQSSSATTVMVVGFVNSGIMTLSQSVGIIMGANVGAAVTPLLLSLSLLGDGGGSINVVTILSAVLGVAGVLQYCFLKGNSRRKNLGLIMIGFAVLMYGMDIMAGTVDGLRDNPQFTQILTMFQNPFMGVLVGTVITAVIQSSGASIGILQALTVTGSVSYALAIPILMGQNIGTCISATLSAIGASKDGKRASVIHTAFNVVSMLVVGTIYCVVYYCFNRGAVGEFLSVRASALDIAVINIIYKLISVALLMPVSRIFEKIACLVIRDGRTYSQTEMLDERLLSTAAVAVQRADDVIGTMSGMAAFELRKDGLSVMPVFAP